MAPPNGSSKSRKPNTTSAAATSTTGAASPAPAATATKPAPKKAVVPALPLPYVKRQAAAAATTAHATTNLAKPDTKTGEPRSNGKQHRPKDSKSRRDDTTKTPAAPAEPTSAQADQANGSGETFPNSDWPSSFSKPNHDYDFIFAAHESVPLTAASDRAVPPQAQPQAPSEAVSTPNKQPPTPSESSTRGSTEPAVNAAQVTEASSDASGNTNHGATKADRRAKSGEPSLPPSRQPVASPALRLPPANSDLPAANTAANNKAPKSRPPPAVSPTRYQMPPPFQPGNRMPGMHPGEDAPRGPRPPMPNGHGHGHPHHQAHPSNSSIHFGGFQESQSSSPAPPHSGGIAPPPGMPFPAGRQHFMPGPGANGFPPMMPYGPDMMPVTTFDNYGRPSMAYAPQDQYPPYRNNYGPSTPHSFHESHSSMEEYNQQFGGRMPMRNGGPVAEEMQMQANGANRMYGPPDFGRMMPNHGAPPHMMPPTDTADELAAYTQQQFGNLDLSDCSLELRYLDDRAAPVRIPGHRFILNRSPELAALLRKQTLPPSPPDRSQQTLLIETSSRWIRSDSFYMAAQRLYGMALLQYPGPRHQQDSGDLADAGSNVEQLDFALSYAAAGQLLGWVPVTRRGCEVATQLIDWQTIERVLEFALDGHNDLGTHDAYKYGDGSKIILDAVVTFIVHNFPPTFELDAEVVTPVQYARLPTHPPPPTPTPARAAITEESTGPSADDKPAVQFGKGRRSQKITNIQFGDLTLTESKPASETETPKASRPAQPVSHAVLSRVLLNIPFTQLKMILESASSGNVNGWANAESRYRIVKAAVDEREARRVKAVDAVVDGRVPDADTLRNNLRAPEPRSLPQWGALGWHEEMLPYGNPDGPALGRKWAPLSAPPGGPVAEYP